MNHLKARKGFTVKKSGLVSPARDTDEQAQVNSTVQPTTHNNLKEDTSKIATKESTAKKPPLRDTETIEQLGERCDTNTSLMELETDDNEFLKLAEHVAKATLKDIFMAKELERSYQRLCSDKYAFKQPGVAKIVQLILNEKIKGLSTDTNIMANMKHRALVLGKDYQQIEDRTAVTESEQVGLRSKAEKWIHSLSSEVLSWTCDEVRTIEQAANQGDNVLIAHVLQNINKMEVLVQQGNFTRGLFKDSSKRCNNNK